MLERQGKSPENEEHSTRYGEFITSYFAWLPLSVQKEKVKDVEKIKNNKNRRKKDKK